MTLRQKAEEAARRITNGMDCIVDKRDGDEARTAIAGEIERLAREFAEKALRSIYDVSDNDQTGSDGARSRGSYSVKAHIGGNACIEKRHYRKELNDVIADVIALAAAELE